MINRKEEIKKKGFAMALDRDTIDQYRPDGVPIDFSKIKVGIKALDDATYNLGAYKKINPRLADKDTILRAISSGD